MWVLGLLFILGLIYTVLFFYFWFWVYTIPVSFVLAWLAIRSMENEEKPDEWKRRMSWGFVASLAWLYPTLWLVFKLGVPKGWAIFLGFPFGFLAYHAGIEGGLQGAIVKLGSWYHLIKYHLILEENTRMRKGAGIVARMGDDLEYEREQGQPEDEDVKEAEPISSVPRSRRKAPEDPNVDIQDPVRESVESLIQVRFRAIADRIKLKTAKQVYEDLAEYWQAVKEAHDAHLEAHQSMARSTPEELREFQEEASHRRKVNKLHREIELEELELKKMELKRRRQFMEQPPPEPKSVEDRVRETLEREFMKFDIVEEVLEERKRQQIRKLSDQLRLRLEEIESADVSPEAKAWMRETIERSIVQQIHRLLTED